ncbi:ABC transporter D family member 2, chloroplastic [Dendrobium catenatum]|uniref:ABC transporter D family member 2, chloroplastic n=1 Tax=Dendrobium catenatum TaxID=906689 RepID=A0A2I0WAK7_9ASPA|nr:ABC transporter D family member 2, chloroplastic [Dendrobium catenatum]
MPSTEDLVHVLNIVSLSDILSRFQGLDCMHEWSSVLSLGEQQRLAFARLLLAKPNFVLMDESTSALDEANEVCKWYSATLSHRFWLCLGLAFFEAAL